MSRRERVKIQIQKYSRILYFLLSWSLLLGVITQVALAGLAVFVDGGVWRMHRATMIVIEFIPVFMFIFGLAGRIPKFFNAVSFVLFFFVNFQYYTIAGWLGVIHSVFALVLFTISLYVAWGSYQIVVRNRTLNMDNLRFQ